MCILAFAINQHPDYPLLLIANRDEFFDRPTKPLHRWPDEQGIVAGKDLEAGGTWLGVNQFGRWAALTNFRDPKLPQGKRSRGELVVDCLQSNAPTEQWLEQLQQKADLYSGFNFVTGDLSENRCLYYSNQENKIRSLVSGYYALSNGHFDHDWPKMKQLRVGLVNATEQPALNLQSLFQLLAQNNRYDLAHLPDTGISQTVEQQLSSVFISQLSFSQRQYGTRSSAIISVNQQGKVTFMERQFVPGLPSCDNQLSFYWQSPT